MEDIRLPRHVIDRLENRWASRLQQDARAWNNDKTGPSSPVTCRPMVHGSSPSSSSALAGQTPGRLAPRLRARYWKTHTN